MNLKEKKTKQFNSKIFYCFANMTFSFILNEWKLFAFLQSLGDEFQTIAHLYTKQFCLCLVSNRGGLTFNSKLRSNPIVTEDILLKMVVR